MAAVTNATRLTLTVGVTGASGSILPKHLLVALERDERVGTVNLIFSDSGLRVMAEELGVSGRSDIVGKLLGHPPVKIQQQNNDDIGANVASGSYATDAMIVLPCSMGTLARIANGMAIHLIERAADVLPEGAAPAGFVRARDAVQPHPSTQHDAGSRSRRDHLPGHSGVLFPSRLDR